MSSEADGFLPSWDTRDEDVERAKQDKLTALIAEWDEEYEDLRRAKLAESIQVGDEEGIKRMLNDLNCENLMD